MKDLTVLTITQHEPHARPFLDAMRTLADDLDAEFVCWDGRGLDLLEDGLDDAVAACPDGWILLLADDEQASDELRGWLLTRGYRGCDNWAFPRRHLWPDADTFIVSAPLWPDLQTRLSVKAKSGGRRGVHAGSPFGTGRVTPFPIDHHKFLVRTEAERRALLAHYVRLNPMAGHPHYAAFSLPEDLPSLELAATTREEAA